MKFIVRPAVIADADKIQGLLYPHYFNESIFKTLKYNAQSTRDVINGYFDGGVVLIAEDGEKAIGFCVLSAGRTFYDDIEADVEMFFVLPEYRGSGVSREMIKNVVAAADMNGAAVIYSSCLSGIGEKNDSLWKNLWGKYGFKQLGTIMMRSK